VIQRGHTVEDVVESFRACKDAGFTLIAHLMLNLPGSDFQKDLEMFKTIFSDERFKPDNIKIYPTLVLEGTKLYELWKRGEYQPYVEEDVIKLIVEAKKILPRWVRIQRIQRDIPANLIVAGVKKSNLREIVLKEMWNRGLRCPCIRCREVGHVKARFGLKPEPENIKLRVERYFASEGEEIFLSYEDVKQDILIGHVRLRYPSEKVFRPEIEKGKSLIVREVHVYGPLIPVGAKNVDGWQHQGYGKLLIKEAEKIAVEEYGAKKILILSALGVKGYYAKLGYRKDGVYMSKNLKH
ncbi:MAG: tRNA uridine(34) 5-carboxymethylaminomethyl modification radical SAM/GNAT enzyme Elp3, partial [Candidatus Bathyarchaeota archaeon]|nr:tRNA uridine(34) 5-carboxymethylaminomethyl modification radical SAM/GNAT enzyme Elp3 [Candidatus Bathyarchaeota archaeon]